MGIWVASKQSMRVEKQNSASEGLGPFRDNFESSTLRALSCTVLCSNRIARTYIQSHVFSKHKFFTSQTP